MSSMLHAIAAVVAVISATGKLGVCVLMTLELACVPLAPEIIMPFAGDP